MLKSIRLAAVGFTFCFAMAAGAQGTVQIGKDGSVKVNSGGNQVDVSGGKVKVQQQGSGTTVETNTDADDADEADTEDTSGSSLDIVGSARKETLACTGNSVVSISGSSNNITVTGECKSLSVAGSANKVAMDGVGEINVSGTSNKVTWKRALGDAKKPKVSVTGVSNKVAKAK